MPATAPDTRRKLFTKKHAAERLGVCEKTLDNWNARGLIRYRYLGPRVPRVHLDDIDRAERGELLSVASS